MLRYSERKPLDQNTVRKPRKASQWTVSARLGVMCVLIIASGALGIVGAFALSKGATFHELNFLHVKHNHSFSDTVEDFETDKASAEDLLFIIRKIREQPIAALRTIGTFEKLILYLSGTSEAITICKRDIALAHSTMLRVESFESGQLTKKELLTSLQKAITDFSTNSEEFEPLATRTVHSITFILILGLTLKAILAAASAIFLARSVARDYMRVEFAEEKIGKDLACRVRAEEERDALNEELRLAEREAGKAEVATGVLHNVGNVLTSVTTSASLIRERLHVSPLDRIKIIAEQFISQGDNLGQFLENDPRGRRFPVLLEVVGNRLADDGEMISTELNTLNKNLEHVKEIISMQQSYAKKTGLLEPLRPQEIMEDALKIDEIGLQRAGTEVIRDYLDTPELLTKKHEVLQIVINLVKNARQALEAANTQKPRLHIVTRLQANQVRFEVSDNGIGIQQEDLRKIFQHGFTTKSTGHGFGLHSCANSAREMGGSMSVTSRGKGKGATFVLSLPVSSDRPPRAESSTSDRTASTSTS